MIWLLFLVACVRTPAELAPRIEAVDTFLIEARGHKMASLAVVVTEGERATLEALSPAGVEVFQVETSFDGTQVHTAQDLMRPTLERIPFHRDLAALYQYTCVSQCTAGPWKLRRDRSEKLHIRGPGGPATVEFLHDRRVLEDRRRGYTLVVLPGGPR